MSDDRVRRRWHLLHARAPAVALLAAFGLVVSACGGGPAASPGVAALGSGASTTTTSAPSAPASPGGGPSVSKLLAFTTCMRRHGIADFPDPTVGPGGKGAGFSIRAQSGSDLNPRSPRFQAASKACQKLLPFGGTSRPPTAAQLTELTNFAACMRQHGFPSFPDPNAQGTFVLHNVALGAASFQAAQQRCNAVAHVSGPMRIQATSSGPAGA